MNTFEDWLKTDIGKIFIENNIFFNKNKAEYMAKAEKSLTPQDARNLSYGIHKKEIDQVIDAIKKESAKPNSTYRLYVKGMPANAAKYFEQLGYKVIKSNATYINVRFLMLDENEKLTTIIIWEAGFH